MCGRILLTCWGFCCWVCIDPPTYRQVPIKLSAHSGLNSLCQINYQSRDPETNQYSSAEIILTGPKFVISCVNDCVVIWLNTLLLGELHALSEVFSKSIFWFYKRKDLMTWWWWEKGWMGGHSLNAAWCVHVTQQCRELLGLWVSLTLRDLVSISNWWNLLSISIADQLFEIRNVKFIKSYCLYLLEPELWSKSEKQSTLMK